MGSLKSNRTVAEALLKTLQRLEADPSVDTQAPAFTELKCTLIRRMLSLHLDAAEIESSLRLAASHLIKLAAPVQPVETPAPAPEGKPQQIVVLRLGKRKMWYSPVCTRS